jgi:hypothetical protein
MTRRRDLWLVTLLTLLAFALRVIDLNGRSLWGDEGITLLRLTSLPDSLSNVIMLAGLRTIDTQPPASMNSSSGFSRCCLACCSCP